MIQIGITGHRILSTPELIEAGILSVLSRISSIYPQDDFTVISALAEGADCLFAKIAISKLQAKLVVRLPLPALDYKKDFSTPDALKTFDELLDLASDVTRENIPDAREDAYFAAGKYILDHCDILVAIWDGQMAQGRGGTGEIVQFARECGRPLAWIQSGNRQPGTLAPIDLGDQQGKVTYERFPDRENVEEK
jgi:hypothetical protein